MIKYNLVLPLDEHVSVDMLKQLIYMEQGKDASYLSEIQKLYYQDEWYTYIFDEKKHEIYTALDHDDFKICPLWDDLQPYLLMDKNIPYSLKAIPIGKGNMENYRISKFYNHYALPIIYIPSINNNPVINPDKLKRGIGLLAHVFYSTSDLYNDTENDCITMIYPSHQTTSLKVDHAIYNRIFNILYIYSATMKYEHYDLGKLLYENEKEEQEFKNLIDDENLEKELTDIDHIQNQNLIMKQENEELEKEIKMLQDLIGVECILKRGKKETEKYEYEQHDLVISILEDIQKEGTLPSESEEMKLLEHILTLNPVKGAHHQWMEELFHFGRSHTDVTPAILNQLSNYGLTFSKRKGSKHYQVTFKDGDQRYISNYSSSASSITSTEHSTKDLIRRAF